MTDSGKEVAPAPLQFEAPPHVHEALEATGRTEDLAFSPSCRRLAIAEFAVNCILLLDLNVEARMSTGRLELTACLEISSTELRAPHGLAFLDEDTIIVANREGAATVFRLPPSGPEPRHEALTPLQTLRGSWWGRIATPGSVAAREVGHDQVEVLVCNNYQDTVTRHRLDRRANYRVRSNRVLLKAGLTVPDGVTFSRDGRWLAVSNHNTHSVLMFENSPGLNARSTPAGALLDVDCPHGLRFSADGRHLLVASAASPFVQVFASDQDEWQGDRLPIASVKVMDDAAFFRGRYNPEEGGPKGLDLSAELNLLALTSEHQPLALFDLTSILESPAATVSEPLRSRLESRSAI
jgi:hypothetical protein